MQQLRDQQVVIEGNKLVQPNQLGGSEKTAFDSITTEDWTEEFGKSMMSVNRSSWEEEFIADEDEGSALNWAREYEASKQQNSEKESSESAALKEAFENAAVDDNALLDEAFSNAIGTEEFLAQRPARSHIVGEDIRDLKWEEESWQKAWEEVAAQGGNGYPFTVNNPYLGNSLLSYL